GWGDPCPLSFQCSCRAQATGWGDSCSLSFQCSCLAQARGCGDSCPLLPMFLPGTG
ncbi:hypothetical protein NDU88_000208, partial [Pleurodeles waltl]